MKHRWKEWDDHKHMEALEKRREKETCKNCPSKDTCEWYQNDLKNKAKKCVEVK